MLPNLSKEIVERKREFCEDIIKTYDVIAPGLTKERGLTLYELVSVKLFLMKQNLVKVKEHDERLIVVKTIKECIKTLEEVIQ